MSFFTYYLSAAAFSYLLIVNLLWRVVILRLRSGKLTLIKLKKPPSGGRRKLVKANWSNFFHRLSQENLGVKRMIQDNSDGVNPPKSFSSILERFLSCSSSTARKINTKEERREQTNFLIPLLLL